MLEIRVRGNNRNKPREIAEQFRSFTRDGSRESVNSIYAGVPLNRFLSSLNNLIWIPEDFQVGRKNFHIWIREIDGAFEIACDSVKNKEAAGLLLPFNKNCF